MSVVACSRCCTPVPDPSERWPDAADGTLCQCCWEAYSSRLWWAVVQQLPDPLEAP